MFVPQHLLSEDRQDYERVLDEALRSAPHRPELAAVGQRLNPEQLRTMALNATALITVAASTEYQHYVKVREELRRPTRMDVPSAERHGNQALEQARQRKRPVSFRRRLLASSLGMREQCSGLVDRLSGSARRAYLPE